MPKGMMSIASKACPLLLRSRLARHQYRGHLPSLAWIVNSSSPYAYSSSSLSSSISWRTDMYSSGKNRSQMIRKMHE